MYARIFALGFIYLLYYMNSETESPIRPFDKDYNVEEFDDVFELEDKESAINQGIGKTREEIDNSMLTSKQSLEDTIDKSKKDVASTADSVKKDVINTVNTAKQDVTALKVREQQKQILQNKKLLQIENNIIYWDQDVFNAYLDGKFYELPESLNCYTNLEDNLIVREEIKIVHFYGSKKPWTTKGILNKKSTYYQDMYRELGLGSYHITHKRRRESVKHLISGIFNLKIIYIKKPISFLKDFLTSLSKKPNII